MMNVYFRKACCLLVPTLAGLYFLPRLGDVFVSARGSYRAAVFLQIDSTAADPAPVRFALARGVNVPDMLEFPNAVEFNRNWRTIRLGESSFSESVRGAFSGGMTLLGDRRRNHPYADTVVIEYQNADGSRRFHTAPIPWNQSKTGATVIVPRDPFAVLPAVPTGDANPPEP